jgi:hypothetical protein
MASTEITSLISQDDSQQQNVTCCVNKVNLFKTEQKKNQSKSQKKERKTLFWLVKLDNSIFEHFQIKTFLNDNKNHKALKEIHSTLLYVGRKDNDDEHIFTDIKNKTCNLKISCYGYSENALCLKIDSIKLDDGNDVPSFAVQPHITLALANDTLSKDSVKTLLGEGTIVSFVSELIIKGKIMRY